MMIFYRNNGLHLQCLCVNTVDPEYSAAVQPIGASATTSSFFVIKFMGFDVLLTNSGHHTCTLFKVVIYVSSK